MGGVASPLGAVLCSGGLRKGVFQAFRKQRLLDSEGRKGKVSWVLPDQLKRMRVAPMWQHSDPTRGRMGEPTIVDSASDGESLQLCALQDRDSGLVTHEYQVDSSSVDSSAGTLSYSQPHSPDLISGFG